MLQVPLVLANIKNLHHKLSTLILTYLASEVALRKYNPDRLIAPS